MADIFVSYKAEDRARVAPVVAALQAEGHSVWWDAHIGGGEDWRATIERELEAARCVIVMWSSRSVGPEGRFVRDEAARAQRRNAYLPVRLDAVEPPLGFGEVQALPLDGWKGNRADPRWQALRGAVGAMLGREAPVPAAEKPARALDRRALMAGAGLLAAGAAGAGVYWRWSRPAASPEHSIAVLPFENLSGDPAQGYFAAGLAEELRSALSRIPGLVVIGRISSEKVGELDGIEAARRLKVADVLTGSVRRSPGMLRVNTQLIDGSDGVELWSETYDRPIADSLAVQSEIARSVASVLRLRLDARAALGAPGGTQDPQAQDLVFKAKSLLSGSTRAEDMEQAGTLLDGAIARDPRYADAIALRAATVAELAEMNFDPQRTPAENARAVAMARRAIAIAPQLARSYNVIGDVMLNSLRFRDALAQYRKAQSLEPGAITNYCYMLIQVGHAREALPILERAIALDPLNSSPLSLKSFALFALRRYQESMAAARETLMLAPRLYFVRFNIVWSLILLGRLDEARREVGYIPASDDQRAMTELLIAIRARDPAWRSMLATLRGRAGNSSWVLVAAVVTQAGDRDGALDALDKAYRVRDSDLISLPFFPFLDPLRSDPRFIALIARLDFP